MHTIASRKAITLWVNEKGGGGGVVTNTKDLTHMFTTQTPALNKHYSPVSTHLPNTNIN